MATYASWHSTAQAGVDALANITDNVTVSDDSYWQANAYDQIRAIYIELGSSPGAGVPGNFTLNNDNSTSDTEDAYIYAERGSVTPNAHIRWDSSANAWELSNDVKIAGSIGSSSNRTTKHWLVDEDISGTLTVNNLTLSGTLSGGTIDVSGATGVNSDTFTIDQDDDNYDLGSGISKFAVSRKVSADSYLGFDEASDKWIAFDGSNARTLVRIDDISTVKVGMLNTDIYSDSGGLWGTQDTLARSDHTHSGGGLAATGSSETIFTFDNDWNDEDVHITTRYGASAYAISINPMDSPSYFDFTHGLIPTTDDSIDLGTTSLRWKKLWLKDADIDGTLDIGGAATLQSTLDVTGNTDIDGTINVAGLGTFQDDINIQGNSLTLNSGQVAGDASFKVALGSGSGDRELKWNNSTSKWTMKSTASSNYVDIVGVSGTQTLESKTLTSPIITGGSWSGSPSISDNPTFSGSPVFSSTPSFTNNPTFTGSPAFSSGTPSFSNTPTFSNATPFTVSNTSASKITNLNADKLDGKEASAFLQLDNTSAQTMSGDLDMGGNDFINVGSLGDHASSHMTGSSDALTGTFGSGVVGTNATTWRVGSTSNTTGPVIYLGGSNSYSLSLAHTGTPSIGMGDDGVDLIPGSSSDNQDLGNSIQRWRSGNFNESININIQESINNTTDGTLWAKASGASSSMQFRLGGSDRTVIDSNNKTGMIGSTGAWSVGGNIDVNNNNIINIGNLSGNPVFTDTFSINWTPAQAQAPFTIGSSSLTGMVNHLNADMVDDKEASDFLWLSGGTRTLSGDISMGGNDITGIGDLFGTNNVINIKDSLAFSSSDIGPGFAPFSVTGLTGLVGSLNADMVDGKHSTELASVVSSGSGTLASNITGNRGSSFRIGEGSGSNDGTLYLGQSSNNFLIEVDSAIDNRMGLGASSVDIVPGDIALNQDLGTTATGKQWRALHISQHVRLSPQAGAAEYVGIGDGSLWAKSGSPSSMQFRLGSSDLTVIDSNNKTGMIGSTGAWSVGGTIDVNGNDIVDMGNLSGGPVFTDTFSINHTDSESIMPFTVNSSLVGKVENLNADKVDGKDADELLNLTGGTMTGDITMSDSDIDMSNNSINNLGTVTGNATFNGNVTFQGSPSFTGSPNFINGTPSFSNTPAFANATPFTVSNTSSKITNLDADKLDGYDSSAFLQLAGGTMAGNLAMDGKDITGIGDLSGTNDVINIKDSLTFTGDGQSATSAPFSVHANLSGIVTYLNADKVDGKDASDFLLRDGTQEMTGDLDMNDKYIKDVNFTDIGSTVPNFKTDQLTSVPFTVEGSGRVDNLNADKLDGKTSLDFFWRDGSYPMTGNLAMGNHAITGASASSDFLLRSGTSASPMTNDLYMGNKNIRELTGLFAGIQSYINIYDRLKFESNINTDHNDTVPFELNSSLTGMIDHLNADMVDGKEASDFLLSDGDTMGGNLTMGGNDITGIGDLFGTNNVINIKDSLAFSSSDIGAGLAPFSVTGLTGLVDDLNADRVDSKEASDFLWLSGGTRTLAGDISMGSHNITNIGNISGTPTFIDAPTFAHGSATTAPFALGANNTGVVTHLNADMVDGKEASDFLLLDGTQEMTGDLDMNDKNIINIGNLTSASFPDAPWFTLSGSGAQPFNLSSNLTGKVTFLNANFLDGYEYSDFLQLAGGTMGGHIDMGGKNITDIGNISGTPTFIDSPKFEHGNSGTAPFTLGTNNTGAKVIGLNADQLDTLHSDDFLLKTGGTMGGNISLGSYIITGGGANSSFLLRDGTNAMTDDLDMGDNDITNIGNILGSPSFTSTGGFSINWTPAQTQAPFTIGNSSLTGMVDHLNADMVDGKEASDFLLLDGTNAMTGDLDMNGKDITGGGASSSFLLKTGGTMGGDLDMGGKDITNIGGNSDFLSSSGGTMAGDLDMDENYIKDVKFTNSGSSVPDFVTTSNTNAPFTVNDSSSGEGTGRVTNLNADMVDGNHSSDLMRLGETDPQTMAGNIAMGGNAITGASASSDFLLRDGTNAMAGNLNMGSNNIISTGVDSSFLLRSGTNAMTDDLDMGSKQIKEVYKIFGIGTGKIWIKNQLGFSSSITQNSPFTVDSSLSGMVDNLNAHMVDGKEASDFLLRDGTQEMTDDLDMGGKQIKDVTKIYGVSQAGVEQIYIKDRLNFSYTVGSSGSPPFLLHSNLTGRVDNLNAHKLNGYESSAFLQLAGGTMAGNLDMGSNNITSTGVNSSFLLRSGTNAMTSDLDMDGNDVLNIDKLYGSDLNNSGVTIIEVEADRLDMKDNIIENVDILESTYLSGTDGLKIKVADKLEFMSDIYYGSSNSITVPFSLHSTLSSKVEYLNADRVDDKEASDFLWLSGGTTAANRTLDGDLDMDANDILMVSKLSGVGTGAITIQNKIDMNGKDITNTDKVYIGSGNSYLESYNGGGGEEIRLYVNGTLAETWS